VDYVYGQVILFAGRFEPRGFARCDGRLLPIHQHSALYSILGNLHGGDGKVTFALPTIDPLGPEGPWYLICVQGAYPARA